MRAVIAPLLSCVALTAQASGASHLKLNDQGYFAEPGLNVMSFSDYYPDGDQTGVAAAARENVASLRGESSNQLLETLEEWNDYLER